MNRWLIIGIIGLVLFSFGCISTQYAEPDKCWSPSYMDDCCLVAEHNLFNSSLIQCESGNTYSRIGEVYAKDRIKELEEKQ